MALSATCVCVSSYKMVAGASFAIRWRLFTYTRYSRVGWWNKAKMHRPPLNTWVVGYTVLRTV